MRLRKLLLFILALGLMITVSEEVNAADKLGEVLYQYNAATAAQEWKFYDRGHWTFDANGISCDNDGRTGDDAWYYTYIGNRSGWTDYVIEADFVNVTEGGIIFRSSNPSNATVDAFDGYYIGTDSDYLFAGKDTNDKWDTIKEDGPDASAAYKIGYKAKMHWKIVVKGDTYTLYLDNAKFPTLQVCDSTYKTGGVAVRYRVYPGDLSGYVQNLKVTKLVEVQDNPTGEPQKGTTNTTPNNISKDTPKEGGSEIENGVIPETSEGQTDNNQQEGKKEEKNNQAEAKKDEENGMVKDEMNEILDGILFGLLAVVGIVAVAIPVVFLVRSKRKESEQKENYDEEKME